MNPFYERRMPSFRIRPRSVNGARYYSLPCAGLAKQEYGRVLRRHLLDPEEHILESIASPDDLAEVGRRGNIIMQGTVLAPKKVL